MARPAVPSFGFNRRLRAGGLGAAATACGPPEHAGNNKGVGNDAAGNDDKVGNGRGPPDQVIVGTKTRAAADEAARQAREVRHRFDFGDKGKAVAGRLLEPARTALEDSAEDIGLASSDGESGLLDAGAASGSIGVDLPSVDTTSTGTARSLEAVGITRLRRLEKMFGVRPTNTVLFTKPMFRVMSSLGRPSRAKRIHSSGRSQES